MAIVVQTVGGCIVDHLQASTATVSLLDSSNNEGSILVPYRLKSDLFEIWEPYRMDSEFDKLHSIFGKDGQTRKRKRKLQELLNCGEQTAEDYHNAVKDRISEVYRSLVSLGRQMAYFHERDTCSSTDNNLSARQAALCVGSSAAFTDMCQQSQTQTIVTCQLTTDTDMSDCDIVDVIWQHTGDQSVMVKYKGDNYIVPPHSEFLMSDIQQLHTVTDALGTYDLVVMDPPWTNKSVKRKKKYYTMENDTLLYLPLHDLMNPGALVVVWVTNKQKHIHFVTEQLFPKHDIQFITRWYWLKVTKTGQCVFDLDSRHKKPYETLIIGKFIPKCSDVTRSQETLHNSSFSNYKLRRSAIESKCEIEGVASTNTDNLDTICCQHTTDQDSNQRTSKHKSNGCASSVDGNHGNSSNIPSNQVTVSNHGNRSDIPSNQVTVSNHGNSSDIHANQITVSNSSVIHNNQVPVGNHGHSSDIHANQMTLGHSTDIRDEHVIISVPCSLHSKKPPLTEVLKPHLPDKPRCLELFARNLLPYWTSWGNEVLLHQHRDFFEEIT